MKHELSNRSSQYGASMGRSDTRGDIDATLPIAFKVIQLAWEDGAYDTGGAYWGGGNGEHIYHVIADDVSLFIRAKSFSEAESQVVDEYPLATFERAVQDTDEPIRYASFEYVGEIEMTLTQAEAMSHRGACDNDVAAGKQVPNIQAQLDAIDPAKLRRELKEYGAWEDDELSDHSANLDRILWLAAGNIVDNQFETVDD